MAQFDNDNDDDEPKFTKVTKTASTSLKFALREGLDVDHVAGKLDQEQERLSKDIASMQEPIKEIIDMVSSLVL